MQIDDAFKLMDEPIRPIIETDATESILNLVQSGAGVSILSKTLLHMWRNDRVAMVRIDNPPLRRKIGLVYHKEKYIGFAAQQFIRLLRQRLSSMTWLLQLEGLRLEAYSVSHVLWLAAAGESVGWSCKPCFVACSSR